MAPKGKSKKTAPPITPQSTEPEPTTIGEFYDKQYRDSRKIVTLCESKGFGNLNLAEQNQYTFFHLFETQTYLSWPKIQQAEFLAAFKKLKIPGPLAPPRDLGFDRQGRKLADYPIKEYWEHEERQQELRRLQFRSKYFRINVKKSIQRRKERQQEEEWKQGQELDDTSVEADEAEIALAEEVYNFPTAEDIQEERQRRVKIAAMDKGKQPGTYAGDPSWDDVVPIPQNDGERPLAAIAYTDEYAEAISYLRAVMAANELSARASSLTGHIINLNPAHYTVWLYRAKILFHLGSSIPEEIAWVNDVALANQKNYQIWHHRQLLVDNLYPTLKTQAEKDGLAKSEIAFIMQMFEEDSKNYHVWSYRQYLVRKLDLFPSQTRERAGLSELESIELLLQEDIRNNSAWSHRFFVVFSDPGICTAGSKATEHDPALPTAVIDGEVEFSKAAIAKAPQNQSPWNYVRGVLRKGGRELGELESFAEGFADINGAGEEDVTSSHALDLLADVWTQKEVFDKADKALQLLGDKYDRIRKNYWDYKRTGLTELRSA